MGIKKEEVVHQLDVERTITRRNGPISNGKQGLGDQQREIARQLASLKEEAVRLIPNGRKPQGTKRQQEIETALRFNISIQDVLSGNLPKRTEVGKDETLVDIERERKRERNIVRQIPLQELADRIVQTELALKSARNDGLSTTEFIRRLDLMKRQFIQLSSGRKDWITCTQGGAPGLRSGRS